jgi:hypothetical protein
MTSSSFSILSFEFIGSVLFLIVVTNIGLAVSLLFERAYQKRYHSAAKTHHHGIYWSKALTIMTRHGDCAPCDEVARKERQLYARRLAARRS